MQRLKKSLVVEQLRRTQMAELLAQGKRLDGRGLLDLRPIKIEADIIEKANGSARVELGHTQVIAGVKVEVAKPFEDTPDKGLLIVNAEVLPLASPYAEPGPPSEEAIELARVVDRGIRESQMISLSELALVPGDKVLAVFADVSVLNVDGNLFDATSHAVVTALARAKVKKHVVEDGKVKVLDELVPLPITTIPISVTMARIGDVLVVDPTAEEEAVMDSRLTLTTDMKGNVCAGQKGDSGTLAYDQVLMARDVATAKGEELRKIIRSTIEAGKTA